MPKTGAKASRDCPGWHGRVHLGIEKKKNLSVTVVQQWHWMFLQLLTKSTAMSHLHRFLVAPQRTLWRVGLSVLTRAWKKQTTIIVPLLHCNLPVPGLWFLMLPLSMRSAQLFHSSLNGTGTGLYADTDAMNRRLWVRLWRILQFGTFFKIRCTEAYLFSHTHVNCPTYPVIKNISITLILIMIAY